MPELHYPTPNAWTDTVMDDFNGFLLDHASCEKKASAMAMTLISHYPDRARLVTAMTELAVEELVHFKEVVKLIQERGLQLGADQKDPYVTQLLKLQRKGSERYFLDRLLIASIVEARGHERFGLIANALPEGNLKQFYKAITASEGRHLNLFEDLAKDYFPHPEVEERCHELLEREAAIVAELPLRAALH